MQPYFILVQETPNGIMEQRTMTKDLKQLWKETNKSRKNIT